MVADDVPGPANFDAWWACWKVYCVILLMLPPTIDPDTGEEILFVTVQALENYFEAFRTLVRENPEVWFMCCRAEDRCRGERMMRVKRELEWAGH